MKIKRVRFDHPINTMIVPLRNTTKTLFEVAWTIVCSKKPHSIGEELINSSYIAMIKSVCRNNVAKQLNLIPLSNNTIKRRIDLMAGNILQQLIKELTSAIHFPFILINSQ